MILCLIITIYYSLIDVMDRVHRPENLKLSPGEPFASRKFEHWLKTRDTFLETLKLLASYKLRIAAEKNVTEQVLLGHFKFDALANLVSSDLWMDIKDAGTFEKAKEIMTTLLVMTLNEFFVQVSTAQFHEQMMLQIFMTGIYSTEIRRRLLEQKKLNFSVHTN